MSKYNQYSSISEKWKVLSIIFNPDLMDENMFHLSNQGLKTFVLVITTK